MKLENLQTKTAWAGLSAWTFRDPRPLAGVAVVGLYIYILASAANIVAVGLEYQFITSARSGPASGPLPAEALDLLATATRIGLLLVYAVVGFIVLKWTYRVVANAYRMANGLGMTVTPGWAIGWYFIPIANLWKPFEAVEQTWRVSHNPAAPATIGTPVVLRWWWGLWLASSLVANVSARLGGTGEDLEMLAVSDIGEMIADAMTIPLTLILIKIIQAISRAQVERRNVADVFS